MVETFFFFVVSRHSLEITDYANGCQNKRNVCAKEIQSL